MKSKADLAFKQLLANVKSGVPYDEAYRKYTSVIGADIYRNAIELAIKALSEVIEYRNTLQAILNSGIFCNKSEQDALEYAIFLIQKEIDGEVE